MCLGEPDEGNAEDLKNAVENSQADLTFSLVANIKSLVCFLTQQQ